MGAEGVHEAHGRRGGHHDDVVQGHRHDGRERAQGGEGVHVNALLAAREPALRAAHPSSILPHSARGARLHPLHTPLTHTHTHRRPQRSPYVSATRRGNTPALNSERGGSAAGAPWVTLARR